MQQRTTGAFVMSLRGGATVTTLLIALSILVVTINTCNAAAINRLETTEPEEEEEERIAARDPAQIFVSFHGGDNGINDIYVYNEYGELLGGAIQTTNDSFPVSHVRHMMFGPDGNLYVVSAYKYASAILVYEGKPEREGDTRRRFLGVYTAYDEKENPAMLHPFAIAFDPSSPESNLYVSSQDTATVSRYYGPVSHASGKPMPLPSVLRRTTQHEKKIRYYPGTFVPSEQVVSNKKVPGALKAVRDIAFGPQDHNLYVIDEDADHIKVFNSTTGEKIDEIKEDHDRMLQSPVHMMFHPQGDRLYIASKENNEILVWDMLRRKMRVLVSQKSGLLDAPCGMAWGGILMDSSSGSQVEFMYVGSRNGRRVYRIRADNGEPLDGGKPFLDDLPDEPEFLLVVREEDMQPPHQLL